MAMLHKVTAEEVKALRATADMPMSECAKVLREKAKDSYIEDLEKENAKLRAVVKAAWGCVNRTVDCHECRLVCGGCTLLSAMKDCGIEVD